MKLFCCSCRRDVALCRCGTRAAFARRAASALRVGDELVEADGCLLTVTSVAIDGREVIVTAKSFGASRVRPMRVRVSRLFSVAADRDAEAA